MKMGIAAKLFLALLAVSAVAVLAMSLGSRLSFTRGFLGYLNDQGAARVEALLPAVAGAYERNGSWDFLRGRPRAWFHLLRDASEGRGFTAEAARTGERAPPEGPPSTELQGLDLRIGLLDLEGRYLAGNAEIGPDAQRRPILVDGARVGWLAVLPFERVSGEANLRFEQRQQRVTWLIAAGSVLLAGIVALWLARRLIMGLKQVTTSVHRLAAGDYTVRVQAPSRDEIGALAEDCNRLAQTLQRTERMRREFTADISHELRTPLAILRGELEALEDGIRQPTPDSIRSLQAEVRTLNKLVEDLYQLSLTDVGALTYRMESLDVCECVHLELESHRERLTQKGIRVEVHGETDGLRMQADEGRLRQLFRNIIENTVRYAGAGGVLRVECRKRDGEIHVDFEDSGPGVADDLLPRLFERFYRVDASRNRASGGAGLGLALCKSIVEAHGGSIVARRSALGGLCISITLPSGD